MDSLQITLNSRTSTVLDNQRRSIMQVSLNKDAIPIAKDMQCSVSVISAEILNNISSIDSSTNQTICLTLPTQLIVVGMTTNRITFSVTDYNTLADFVPVNTRVVFTGNVSGATNGLLTSGTTYYVRAFFPPNQIGVTATINGSQITGFNIAYTTASPMFTAFQATPYQTALRIPNGNYTAATLANAINNTMYAFSNMNGIVTTSMAKIICTNSTSNILSLSSSNISMYFPQALQTIGITTPFTNPVSNITCSNVPFLQNKYLQIGTSFCTTRGQPICKIPVNAAYGSYILFNPNVPFPVRINDDLINTFQVSLLDENSQPVNNNFADWSVTLQFDFKKKSHNVIDE